MPHFSTIELVAIGIAIIFLTLFVVPYGIVFVAAAIKRRRPPKK
jgi:hypothetical protein